MYEIQGVKFTLDQLKQQAVKYNMSIDDYLKAMEVKGLKQVEVEIKPEMSVEEARQY